MQEYGSTRSCTSCHVQQDKTARRRIKRQAHPTTHNIGAASVGSTSMARAACKTRRAATSTTISVAGSALYGHSSSLLLFTVNLFPSSVIQLLRQRPSTPKPSAPKRYSKQRGFTVKGCYIVHKIALCASPILC